MLVNDLVVSVAGLYGVRAPTNSYINHLALWVEREHKPWRRILPPINYGCRRGRGSKFDSRWLFTVAALEEPDDGGACHGANGEGVMLVVERVGRVNISLVSVESTVTRQIRQRQINGCRAATHKGSSPTTMF